MSQQHCHFEASRCLTALEQDSTIIAVIEMSQSKWLVAALVPGVKRHPLKKLDAHEEGLLKLLHRWCHEAAQAGREIKRIVVAWRSTTMSCGSIELNVVEGRCRAEEDRSWPMTSEARCRSKVRFRGAAEVDGHVPLAMMTRLTLRRPCAAARARRDHAEYQRSGLQSLWRSR